MYPSPRYKPRLGAGAGGGNRTPTVSILSRSPLPVGLHQQTHQTSLSPSTAGFEALARLPSSRVLPSSVQMLSKPAALDPSAPVSSAARPARTTITLSPSARQCPMIHTLHAGGIRLEAPGGFEPPNNGFAVRCLTTWLRRRLDDRTPHSTILTSWSPQTRRPERRHVTDHVTKPGSPRANQGLPGSPSRRSSDRAPAARRSVWS